MKKRILIAGCSGHARVVCDIIRLGAQHEVVGFIDNKANVGDLIDGLPVLGSDNEIDSIVKQHSVEGFIIGIGDNFLRERVANQWIVKLPNLQYVTAIHPSASIASYVKIGPGVVIMAQAVVGVGSTVEEGVIINTAASIDHECSIGSYAAISPGATMGGNCHIGERAFVGLGANICHGCSIGNDTVIGVGSLVMKDIGNLQVAYGSPIRSVRSRSANEKYL